VVATTAATTTTTTPVTGTTLPAMAPVPGAALGAPFGALALYQPPPTVEGLPGDVVWAAPRPAPAGARAWTVLYLTQDDDGLLAPVSGVVLAPEGPAPPGGRPIVTWAHGTVGSADPCAPSRHGDLGIPALEQLLDEGYVVAATDYPGLGTPGAQHYLDGGSEGRSVLDAARAAMRLTQTGAGPDVLIWGHSQGGHAALFAAQQSEVHAPDLRVRGLAVAAPVTRVSDLIGLAGRTIPGLGAYYLMAVAGLIDRHPTLDRNQLLSPAGNELLARVEQDCLRPLALAVVVRNERVGAADSLVGTAWAAPVAAADLGPAPLPMPVLVAQGGQDPLVLLGATEAAVRTRCALGDTVDLRTYAAADHDSVLDASLADTLAFFSSRLDGDTPTSDC